MRREPGIPAVFAVRDADSRLVVAASLAVGHMIDPVWVVVSNASGTAILGSKVFSRWGAVGELTRELAGAS